MTTMIQARQIQIVEFEDRFQESIENLVLPIQQAEFGVQITKDDQPDLVNIRSSFMRGSGNFWVALCDDKVVGSIGVFDIGDYQVALKKMFVDREFRGKYYQIGSSLMGTAKSWCQLKGVKQIYLGTTSQMKAAQRFYEKNEFIEVQTTQLPTSFPIVHVDTKFYRCDIESLDGK